MAKNMYVIREILENGTASEKLVAASIEKETAMIEAERLNRIARKRDEMSSYRVEAVPMIVKSASIASRYERGASN